MMSSEALKNKIEFKDIELDLLEFSKFKHTFSLNYNPCDNTKFNIKENYYIFYLSIFEGKILKVFDCSLPKIKTLDDVRELLKNDYCEKNNFFYTKLLEDIEIVAYIIPINSKNHESFKNLFKIFFNIEWKLREKDSAKYFFNIINNIFKFISQNKLKTIFSIPIILYSLIYFSFFMMRIPIQSIIINIELLITSLITYLSILLILFFSIFIFIKFSYLVFINDLKNYIRIKYYLLFLSKNNSLKLFIKESIPNISLVLFIIPIFLSNLIINTIFPFLFSFYIKTTSYPKLVTIKNNKYIVVGYDSNYIYGYDFNLSSERKEIFKEILCDKIENDILDNLYFFLRLQNIGSIEQFNIKKTDINYLKFSDLSKEFEVLKEECISESNSTIKESK